MVVRFLSLKIENFKSIDSLEIEFGDTTTIYGANETGKTSVADAIAWVLTGKNSLGESTFNIVPIGTEGVSPSVELKISIGGPGMEQCKKPTLKRVQKAKIGRDKQFTGEYATECYINGVKYTQRDFDRWIEDNICDPEIFRLVHDVKYFTENISTNGKERHWEARRRLLTSVCGLQSDYQLAVDTERFRGISERLSNFDDSAQLLAWLKAEIASAETDLHNAVNLIDMLAQTGNNVEKPNQSKDELIAKAKQLKERRAKLLEDYNFEVEERNSKSYSLGQASVQAGKKVSKLNSDLSNAFIRFDAIKENYEKYGIACPTCGRKFSRGFSEKKKAEYDANCEKLNAEIETLNEQLEDAKKEQEAIERAYKEVLSKPQPKRPAGLDELEKEFTELMAQIAVIEHDEKQKEMSSSNMKKAQAERDKLSEKLSHLQRDYDLTKDFISFKAELVEQKVNELCNGVELRMFKRNRTDGEIKDCCEVFWHKTPYNGLSYSTKFITSLRIVKMFQYKYDLRFPILVDNAESITFDEKTDAQMIFFVMKDSVCPECGAEVGRKQANGMWKCKKCGSSFKKKLTVE